MSKPQTRRRGGLFPRALGDVVKAATKPMMDKQGKIYGALLRDWPQIVGAERAACTRPTRLQWPAQAATGATLHVEASVAKAPELAYETEQMLEQCARHFGYRAIARIVLHPVHGVFASPAPKPQPLTEKSAPTKPRDMGEILRRMRDRIAGDDKRDQ